MEECNNGGLTTGIFSPVVKWISLRSILEIERIYELPIISIDFVLDFTRSYLDVDVFMDLTLVMGVDLNRG